MNEKRSLFQKIFGGNGKPKQDGKTYTDFKLLNTSVSTYVPFDGNAWSLAAVQSATDAFARRVAIIKPKHIRRAGGTTIDANSAMNNVLQFYPNPYSTAYKLYYRLAVQYKLYHNAFLYPVWGAKGELIALYNINAPTIRLLEYAGELMMYFQFGNGNKYIFPYTDFIAIGSHYKDNDIFGDDTRALLPVLQTADTFNQSMAKSAELVSIIRGILEVNASSKDTDLKKRRDDFVRDNLNLSENGSGIIVTDSKYKYTNLDNKNTPLPQGQLTYIKNEIFDYFGTNEKIVQNTDNPDDGDAYYDGAMKPFFVELEQAMTNCLFTKKERGFGNEIVIESNRLQSARLSDKVTTAKFLSDIGAATLDQILDIFNLPAIGGEEGKRRVQTLNVVNAAKADEYQLGKGKDKEPQDGKTTPDDKTPPADDGTNKEEQ